MKNPTARWLGRGAAAILAVAMAGAAMAAPSKPTQGEVRRIDPAGGKVTLKHGPIAELELPAITLVYIAEPAMLQGVQPGDVVVFVAERINGQYTLIELRR